MHLRRKLLRRLSAIGEPEEHLKALFDEIDEDQSGELRSAN